MNNQLAKPLLFCSLAFMAGLPAAQAHITLQEPSATQGAYHRAAFKVGHGCEGSPTVRLEVTLPEGLLGAKPMPKPGWQLSTEVEMLARPVTQHGRQVTERVARVVWSGGTLPDAFYDEFVMQFQVAAAAGPLWFNVEQVCEKGRNAWVEKPAGGTDTKGMRFPAALLEVLPAHGHGHQH